MKEGFTKSDWVNLQVVNLRERVGSPGVDAGAADGPQLVVGVGVLKVALVGMVEHGWDLVPKNRKNKWAMNIRNW